VRGNTFQLFAQTCDKNFSDNKEIRTFLQVKISETSVIYLYITDFTTLDTPLNTKDYYSKIADKKIVSP
jgi:hypothetical protein